MSCSTLVSDKYSAESLDCKDISWCVEILGHGISVRERWRRKSRELLFNHHLTTCTIESIYPANICWFSRSLQDMSWRQTQHVLIVTIFHLPRCFKDVLKTPWKTKNCYAENVFKTPWRHVLKTSLRHVLKTFSRHLRDEQNIYWKCLYLTNLNVYQTSLYFTNLYLKNLRRIQNALIRTQ